MWQRFDVAELPASDQVFTDGAGRYIKTRIVRVDDSGHPADIRAKNIFLHVSGSACDSLGWALPDGEGGHCIAPEKSITLSIAEMQAAAIESGLGLAATFEQRCDALRLDCCEASVGIDEAIALKMAIPIKG